MTTKRTQPVRDADVGSTSDAARSPAILIGPSASIDRLERVQHALATAGVDAAAAVLTPDLATALGGRDPATVGVIVLDLPPDPARGFLRTLHLAATRRPRPGDAGDPVAAVVPPVIALVEDLRPSTTEPLAAAGARELLCKPFELGALVRLIEVQRRDHLARVTLAQHAIELEDRLDNQLRERLTDREEFVERVVEVQELERARLAADIHDDALQSLAAVALRLEALERRVAAGRGDATEHRDEIAYAVHHLRVTAEKLRTLVFGSPPPLDSDELLTALADRIHELAGRSAPKVLCINELGVALPSSVALALWRAGQEAIGNVVKHAAASSVVLQLTNDHREARLLVLDDGRGFDTERAGRTGPPGHVGLQLMAERVGAHGGTVSVTSEVGQGTRIDVVLPLKRTARSQTE